MIARTIGLVERGLIDQKLAPVAVPDKTPIDVIPDTRSLPGEIGYLEIFNAGANKAYFAFGRNCDDAANFNGWIVPGQAMAIITRERVSVYCVGGTTISRTCLTRVDFDFTTTRQ